MSIIHRNIEQGSAEWFAVRIGKPTASMAHKIVTPTGKLSEQRHAYMYRLIAERLLLESMDDPLHIEHIERGKAYEPYAAQQFAFLENCELETVGFVESDDGLLGCSPDRLIKDRNEAVEIKCPAPWTQIGRLVDGIGADYKPQVQMQLLVGEFDRIHFYSYQPRMPPFHIITLRDKGYQAILKQHLYDFADELEAKTEKARALGAYQPSPHVVTPHERTAPGREPDAINILPE